jgi:hypothetical protein
MGAKNRKILSKAHFPPEIWTNVFEFLHTTKSFYSLYFLSKQLHSYPWKSFLKQLEFKMKEKTEFLEHFDFSYVSSLNLKGCEKISDNGLEHLKGIHTLNECQQITDKGLSHLKGIHTLNLRECKQFSDNGLEHLKGIHTLNLNECQQITDKGLSHLKGIHTLNLRECKQITDNGLEHLKGIHTLMK